jgi:oxygen-independent coproporphyrinogen-3 oxidase
MWMNRAHNQEESEKCIQRCRDYGFTNFSIDLIFGIPISSEKKWVMNLEKAISYHPHHISCYALTVEEKTALAHHIKVGKSPDIIDEDIEKQFYIAHDMLIKAGYEHYEISNYSKPSHKSIHNSSYWKNEKYLGIGPSAHSYDLESRSWNIANLPKYIKGIKSNKPLNTREELTIDDQYNEWIMTGIRGQNGLDKSTLKLKFSSFVGFFDQALAEIPKEYIDITTTHIQLSRKGLIFADYVGRMLFKV